MQSDVGHNEQPSSASTAASGAPPSKRSSKRNRKSRGKGLRVRTGCHCCRARHLKCDESRPVCKACEKSGRPCDYPLTAATAPTSNRPADDHQPDRPEHASSGQSLDGQHFDLDGGPSQSISAVLYAERENSPLLNDAAAFDFSPGSTWSDWPNISAESATHGWFDLVATDAVYNAAALPDDSSHKYPIQPLRSPANIATHSSLITDIVSDGNTPQDLQYVSRDDVKLSSEEARLLQHYVCHLSTWIDITDPDRSFAILVPQLALRNRGLMNALLALSARHLLLDASCDSNGDIPHPDRASALQYYHNTLHWLQNEMKNPLFLRSDELLATALLISTYEMIDGSGRGWERHLKGVFWIQRSQLIHGESDGLKKRIWWAWLRQDLWAAFKERRKILSFYHLTKTCADLDFWELVNRAVWLLGQCVNYASLKEEEAGHADVQARLSASTALWEKLEEWSQYFATFDRRLPTMVSNTCAFEPIWINPPAAALAVQVHHVSRLLLIEYTPATSGLKELKSRQSHLQHSLRTVCGIACCIYDEGLAVMSEQCVYAAGLHAHEEMHRFQVLELLRSHQSRTKWPQYNLGEELEVQWANDTAVKSL